MIYQVGDYIIIPPDKVEKYMYEGLITGVNEDSYELTQYLGEYGWSPIVSIEKDNPGWLDIRKMTPEEILEFKARIL
jgi:hypothetical protein